jgi:hypothetical protein
MKDLCTYAPGHTCPATVPVPLNPKSRKAFSRRRTNILVILLSVSLLLLSQFSTAQAPQQFSFQGVARGVDGKILVNKNIALELVIHEGSANGPQVFSELHKTTTNPNGIFNLQIGSINSLDNIAIAYDGQPNVSLGTTQLLSVPYSLHATRSMVSKKWIDYEPIIQIGADNQGSLLPDVPDGTTMIWYPKEAGFRVGKNLNSSWNRNTIGSASFATGRGTIASGQFAAAFGDLTEATGPSTFAIGAGSKASGINSFAAGNNSIASFSNAVAMGNAAKAANSQSIALGYEAEATGNSAVAIGNRVYAKSSGSVALGSYNNDADAEGATLTTDRIFQLGNGTTNALRSNAITVLRNGNIGIGNNVLTPEYIMDFGGRPRIRHNSGSTAGLFFNDSQNTPEGFVGMVNDNEIGFYIGDAWRFVVNKSGTVYADQFFTTSDKSLKSDITPIKNSLVNLTELSGYNYRWKSKNSDNGLQTGLLAQEVEIYFPNLVTTKKDGFKAVNYIGLIPHLIEAVKELDKKTEEISALKKELASVQEMNKKLNALEANVKELLAGQAGTSTQTGK